MYIRETLPNTALTPPYKKTLGKRQLVLPSQSWDWVNNVIYFFQYSEIIYEHVNIHLYVETERSIPYVSTSFLVSTTPSPRSNPTNGHWMYLCPKRGYLPDSYYDGWHNVWKMVPKAPFDVINMFTKTYLQGMFGPAHIPQPTWALQQVDYTHRRTSNEWFNQMFHRCTWWNKNISPPIPTFI